MAFTDSSPKPRRAYQPQKSATQPRRQSLQVLPSPNVSQDSLSSAHGQCSNVKPLLARKSLADFKKSETVRRSSVKWQPQDIERRNSCQVVTRSNVYPAPALIRSNSVGSPSNRVSLASRRPSTPVPSVSKGKRPLRNVSSNQPSSAQSRPRPRHVVSSSVASSSRIASSSTSISRTTTVSGSNSIATIFSAETAADAIPITSTPTTATIIDRPPTPKQRLKRLSLPIVTSSSLITPRRPSPSPASSLAIISELNNLTIPSSPTDMSPFPSPRPSQDEYSLESSCEDSELEAEKQGNVHDMSESMDSQESTGPVGWVSFGDLNPCLRDIYFPEMESSPASSKVPSPLQIKTVSPRKTEQPAYGGDGSPKPKKYGSLMWWTGSGSSKSSFGSSSLATTVATSNLDEDGYNWDHHHHHQPLCPPIPPLASSQPKILRSQTQTRSGFLSYFNFFRSASQPVQQLKSNQPISSSSSSLPDVPKVHKDLAVQTPTRSAGTSHLRVVSHMQHREDKDRTYSSSTSTDPFASPRKVRKTKSSYMVSGPGVLVSKRAATAEMISYETLARRHI